MLGFLDKIRMLITKNPMGLFVYGILSKWYITIVIAGVIVAYWVLKGLSDAGVLQASEKVVFQALNDTKSVARYCVPKITRLGDFWDCLQDPPVYQPTKDEETLQKGMNKLLDLGNIDPNKEDPYAK